MKTKTQKIKTETVIGLDMVDRLKVLFGRKLKVDVHTELLLKEEAEEITSYNAHAVVSTISSSKVKFQQDLRKFGYMAPVADPVD